MHAPSISASAGLCKCARHSSTVDAARMVGVVGNALRRIVGLVGGGMCVGWLTCLYCFALASLFPSAPPHGHAAAMVMVCMGCMGCVCGCGVME
jgi:hypothetical protein